MAMIIDGKEISLQVKDEIKKKVEALKGQGKEITLAVIQVGDNPASTVYVRNKKRGCEYTGIRSLSYELAQETGEEEIQYCLEALEDLVPILKRYARR